MDHVTMYNRTQTNKPICVRDMRVLNALAKAGHIELHHQTGTTVYWYGQKFKTYYIEDAVGPTTFEHKGNVYKVEYRSGSFYPYVFQY